MPSERLRRARAWEAERLPRVSPELLPRFHVTGGVGWINDPNGFSLYRGEIHLFFQYNPYDTRWASMHWGHVKTRDFIRWERLPCAMAPDEDYDRDGCFSGSAVEMPDGRHLLLYTGVRKTAEGDEVQTQCLAFGDGENYEKYGGNPVIDGSHLPPGGSARDFRDPRIWAENGKYFCAAGDRCPDGSGAVLLFESGDALNWRYAGTLAASENQRGRMWECPDFFSLDGKKVLLVSPQEMRAEGLEFIEGNTTLCLIGEQEPDGSLSREGEQTIDYGLDFYAPQTVLTADGRRVMIAWMQYWNSVEVHPRPELPFYGQMTLPRELHVRDGRLLQHPVRELNAYRGACVTRLGVEPLAHTELPGIRGRCLDLMLDLRPGPGGYRRFTVNVAEGEGYVTSIRYEPGRNTVSVDRRRSGWPEGVLNEREFFVRDRDGELSLRIILDRYSLEIFANGGEQAASFAIFAPPEADGISFGADGAAVLDAECYELEV